jgi:enoyl-CoA hydratase
MSEETVISQISEGIAWITINRPKAMNAINTAVLVNLKKIIDQLKNDQSTKVVILTGAGEKAFVAGADIGEMQNFTPLQARAFSVMGQEALNSLANLPQPVIAAINGFALGGGCELALACDLRIAARNAKLGLPEVGLGVIPGFAGTQRLPRLIGQARAKQLIFSGEIISAEESERIGLVNKVVEQTELREQVLAMATKIAAQGPQAVRLAKEAINQGGEMELAGAQVLESNLFAVIFSSDQQREGMTAFIEKRKPNFK